MYFPGKWKDVVLSYHVFFFGDGYLIFGRELSPLLENISFSLLLPGLLNTTPPRNFELWLSVKLDS